MTPWDQFVDDKMHFLSSHCQGILDCGGGTPFQKELKAYEGLFNDSIANVCNDGRVGRQVQGAKLASTWLSYFCSKIGA